MSIFLKKKSFLFLTIFCIFSLYNRPYDYYAFPINVFNDASGDSGRNTNLSDFVRSGAPVFVEPSSSTNTNGGQSNGVSWETVRFFDAHSKANYSKSTKAVFHQKSYRDFEAGLSFEFKTFLDTGETLPYVGYQDFVFKQYNKYQFEGYRDYIKTLPNFEEWVNILFDHFWKSGSAKKNRGGVRGQYGFRKYEFPDLIKSWKGEIAEKSKIKNIVNNDFNSQGSGGELDQAEASLESSHLAELQVADEDVISSAENSASNVFTSATNQEEIIQAPIQQLEIKQSPDESQGFMKKAVGKVLDFCNNPRVVQAVDNAVQAGIRNVLLDEQLDFDIQETVNQIKEIISPPDLSSDFRKKYIDPYTQETGEQFSALLHQDKLEFKELVDNKIILTESELNSFYNECTNSDVSRVSNPVSSFHNEYSKEACMVVHDGLDLAKDYSCSNELEIASDITDFSSALLDATKSTFKFFKLVGEGSFQALSKYKNPLNVMKEFGEGFVNLGIGLSKATLKFAEYNYNCIADPDRAVEMLDNFLSSTAKKLKEIQENFSHLSYEDKVVFVARTLTECVIDGAVMGGAFKFASKAGKFFKALPALVEKEAGVAKLAGRLFRENAVKFKEVVMPLGNAVMETTEYWQIAGTSGIKISKASLEVVSKNKGLIASEGRISKAVTKVIKRTNKTKNKFINLASERRTRHIIIGEKLPHNKFSGGHKFPGNPGKTAFPKSWSEEKIMHAISDIATDPNLQWIPQTGNGGSFTRAGDPAKFIVKGIRDKVKIKVVIEPVKEGVISGYPFNSGGVGVTCKAINI